MPRIFIMLIPLFYLSSCSLAHGQANSYKYPGRILINVFDFTKFQEFTLKAGILSKTKDGKVSRMEKDNRTQIVSWTEEFKELYLQNRAYRVGMRERIDEYLSKYDLIKLENMQTHFFRSFLFENKKVYENENIYLTGPGRRPSYFNISNYIGNKIYPNREFSYAIYHHLAAVLINLATNRITFPFGIDDLKNVDWNSNGNLVAYSLQGYQAKEMLGGRPQAKIRNQDHGSLVIQDIINEKNLLRKSLGIKYVECLSWSPDSSYIGLITFKSRLGKWPWELLSALAGHPVYYKNFSVEIYDKEGNLLDLKEIEGSYKFGIARIVWI